MKKVFFTLAILVGMTTLLSFSNSTENKLEEERPEIKTYIIYTKNNQTHWVIVNSQLDCNALMANNETEHNNGVTITDCWHDF